MDHNLINGAQQRGYRALQASGKPITWSAVRNVEVEALIAGGMKSSMAKATVRAAIKDLKAQGVKGPVRIPWGN